MNNLQQITDQAIAKTGITDLQNIYQGLYYSKTNIRDIIYSCQYQGKSAVLKVYDDPREMHPAPNLKLFHDHNQSSILRAPELLVYQEFTSHSGWLLMEKLPEQAKRFEYLMSSADRTEFLQVFLEYRQNYPITAPREISLAENLSSSNFLAFRLNRWLELASKADSTYFLQTAQHFYDPKILIQKFQTSLTRIREVFLDRPMLWSHGSFKNHEVYSVGNGTYYLLDFGNGHLFPQGYELGYMVWADYLMSDNWQHLTTQEWLNGIENWLQQLLPVTKKLKYPNPEKLLYGSLLERTWGTILADVIGSDRPLTEKQTRLKLLFALVEHCLDQL